MDWRNLITLKGNPFAVAEHGDGPDWRLVAAIGCIGLGAVLAVAGLLGLLLGAGRYGFRGILLGLVVAGIGAYLLFTNERHAKARRRRSRRASEDGAS